MDTRELTELVWLSRHAVFVATLKGEGRSRWFAPAIMCVNEKGKPNNRPLRERLDDSSTKDFIRWLGFVKSHTKAKFNKKKKMEKIRSLTDQLAKTRGFRQKTGRIFPLPTKRYDEFTGAIYARRGRPCFRKRIISGVQWGPGRIVTNGKTGMKRVIIRRILGCELQGTRFVITCPD